MALVNGEKRNTISVSNRGLAYGDGVFTTARVVNRRPQLWEAHRRRLEHDCGKLMLAFDLAALGREVAEACADAPNPAVLKVILTRGDGERGYRPPSGSAVRIVQTTALEPYPREYLRQGVAVTVCHLHLPHAPSIAGVKHLNRLEQVLARAEWDDEYREGLMLDSDGHVIEGTMSNLFIAAADELLTPKLDRCGVAGVMREHIIVNASSAGLSVREVSLTLDDLYQADGLFVCNSIIGAWPVARIGEHDCAAAGFISGRFQDILKLTVEEP